MDSQTKLNDAGLNTQIFYLYKVSGDRQGPIVRKFDNKLNAANLKYPKVFIDTTKAI